MTVYNINLKTVYNVGYRQNNWTIFFSDTTLNSGETDTQSSFRVASRCKIPARMDVQMEVFGYNIVISDGLWPALT
jgi:hypothetical protein